MASLVSRTHPVGAGADDRRRSTALGRLALWVVAGLLCSASLVTAQASLIGAAKETTKRHWLVTRDGQRIEASGPWEVRGPRILYPNLAGDLVSIRLDEIDLQASELATNPPPPPAPPPVVAPTPVLVLRSNEQPELAAAPTEPDPTGNLGSDVAPSPAAAPGQDGDEAERRPDTDGTKEPADSSVSNADAQREPEVNGEQADRQAARTPPPQAQIRSSSAVQVISWRDIDPEFDSASVYGTLQNTSQVNVSGIRLEVIALDEAGGEIRRQNAILLASKLGPGETTNFRSIFPDLGAHSEFRFEVEATR
jgi:hypothetical protein